MGSIVPESQFRLGGDSSERARRDALDLSLSLPKVPDSIGFVRGCLEYRIGCTRVLDIVEQHWLSDGLVG
jgi:hypothetical protein